MRAQRQQSSSRSSKASQTAAWLGGDIDDALADIRVPAFILSHDGVIQWQNERAIDVVGDARGVHFSAVVAPESVQQARVEFTKHVVGGARTTNREVVMRSPGGTRTTVEVQAVSLADGRRVVGVFGVMEVATDHAVPTALRGTLTPRQHQVLAELARGASTAQIAASLGIARETVRNHVRGVLRELRVHSRLEAVAEARRRGLLGP